MKDSVTQTLKSVPHLYETGKMEEVVKTMNALWARKPKRTQALGEGCRFARVAAYRRKRFSESLVWEARALTTFSLTGSLTGMANILMTRVFAVLAEGYEDPSRLEDALSILDEMKPLLEKASPNSTPKPELGWRIYHEKRAFVLYLMNRYEDAIKSYEKAIVFTKEDLRGKLKVRGGQALCKACLGDVEGATKQLKSLLAEAKKGGFDIVSTFETNLKRMSGGGARFTPQHFVPFETI